MENNDYRNLDWLFPNTPTLREDEDKGKDAPAIAPSITVNNPPVEPTTGAVNVRCPLCQSETETAGEPDTYKCKKCGKAFTMKKSTMKEASHAEESLISQITEELVLVERDVKELYEAMVDGKFSKVTVDALEKLMNALNDIRKLLGGQTWYDMVKKEKGE